MDAFVNLVPVVAVIAVLVRVQLGLVLGSGIQGDEELQVFGQRILGLRRRGDIAGEAIQNEGRNLRTKK